MSDNEENNSQAGFDSLDHQPVYVYAPAQDPDAPTRPAKRRKVAKPPTLDSDIQTPSRSLKFEPLLNNSESPECVALRQKTFERAWSTTDARIQAILDEANEGTLTEVTEFVQGTRKARSTDRVPTGLIVTGPNISSQSLLFKQLSARLKVEINGPIVVLRSGDASNLKAVLKQLIRDATNQRHGDDDEDGPSFMQDGRKLLNYDLEILHGHVKARGSEATVIAFQDSEAFDSGLLSELVHLFSCWMDRIPFVLLFGIATSLDLFHERLSMAASRVLEGVQFDVEQTSSLLERIFQEAVAGADVPLRLGSVFVSSLMERQYNQMQSVQSFVAALKFAYMCHFYGNPLSWLCDDMTGDGLESLLQPGHYKAIRTLRSFKSTVEECVGMGHLSRARAILGDDKALFGEIKKALESRRSSTNRLLRAMSLFSAAASESIDKVELYQIVFDGHLAESDFYQRLLDSIKRMMPEDLIKFAKGLTDSLSTGSPGMELAGWTNEENEFLEGMMTLHLRVTKLVKDSAKAGTPLKSSYAIHTKGGRTTLTAQGIRWTQEQSTLTEQDKEFTELVDTLLDSLKQFLSLEAPRNFFLSEVWIYDSTLPYQDVFTPRPRAAIEFALSAPYDYLQCSCCDPGEGVSLTHPATAVLYQMYLETGSLINIFDLWSAFLDMVSDREQQKCDERDALVLFYRTLADLKSLGMVKQSKRKADHLAKVAWKGL